MAKKFVVRLALIIALLAGAAWAQDARTAIADAQKVIGDVQSIRYSGTGKMGGFGQNWNPYVPWHQTIITSYTRTIDYPSKSSREEFTRTQETPPDHGGETPFEGEQKFVNLVSGQYAWNQPGNAPQAALGAAAERQLQIWLTPHGFLLAAAENNATATEKTENGEWVMELTFMIGKNKVVGDIDSHNNVTKVETWIANPVLGDMPVETTYSNYKTFVGMMFPMHIVQKEGGFATLDLNVSAAQANVPNASLSAPESVKQATAAPVQVDAQKLADGLWWLGGGSHNSLLVEFKNFVAVVEAPNNEARSEAVIAKVKQLVPEKPIRYVINTHHHFDHSGGLRTYVAEGVTVITNKGNKAFYEKAWAQPRTIEPDKLSEHPRKAKFIAYKNKYVLSDDTHSIELYRNVGDNHNEYLTLVYLPKEKLLMEPDDFNSGGPGSPPLVPMAKAFSNNLIDNVDKWKLDVVTLAPVHGPVIPMAQMRKELGR